MNKHSIALAAISCLDDYAGFGDWWEDVDSECRGLVLDALEDACQEAAEEVIWKEIAEGELK